MKETIEKILMKVLNLNEAEVIITEDTSFYELNFDSLSRTEFIVALEKEFNISIDERNAEKIGSIRETMELITTLTKE